MATHWLKKRITLAAGWHNTAAAARIAARADGWSGTIEEFWANNPERTFGEMSQIAALSPEAVHHVGGGAAGCFTIIREG